MLVEPQVHSGTGAIGVPPVPVKARAGRQWRPSSCCVVLRRLREVACHAGIALLLLLVACAGCGKRETVPLSGTVKLDGKPLPRATVVFLAQTPGGRDALGSTDVSGVFRLSTFEPGDGALRGRYKVVVQRATELDPDLAAMTPAEAMEAPSAGRKPPRAPMALPPRYSQPGQTVLMQDVPATGEVLFELESK